MQGVEFALYPQVIRSVNGVKTPGRDYYAVSGFGDLITDANGYVCYPINENGDLDNIKTAFENGTLKPGTYYLHEKGAYSSGGVEYQPLASDVIFTVSPTGTVTEYVSDDQTIHGFPSGTELTMPTSENENIINYQINVKNVIAGTHTVTIKKVVADGTDTDEAKEYEFKAKLYLPDKITPWTYNVTPFTNGEYSFKLTHDGTTSFTVPTGAS